MTFLTKTNTKEQGISLLIVLLVGTILLFTSLAVGQYALRMVNSIRARSEATQTLYTAEQTFECVKYWLRKDYKHFSTLGGALSAECNGTTFHFETGNFYDSNTAQPGDDGVDPTYSEAAGLGIAKFRIPFDSANPNGGGVVVEVERTLGLTQFDGKVRVYSQSGKASGSQTSERFQEYKYEILNGADIMFVIDRSGSIEGDRGDRTQNDDWNTMIDSVNSSIRLLNLKVPSPWIGLVSFGTDAFDTGVDDGNNIGRLPDVSLTNTITDLISDNALIGDINDDIPKMTTTNVSATNLSLGISIAGAELMGSYYPFNGIAGFGNPPGQNSGDFENMVANGNNNFVGNLPSQSAPADRNDTEFPDVIVVITDGAPNGIMTHIGKAWDESAVDGSNDFYTASSTYYDVGMAKIFRTKAQAGGNLLVDELGDVLDGTGTTEYTYCNDDEILEPKNKLTAPNRVNDFPRMAMCNATLIAEQLKQAPNNIKFIAIYVGDDEDADYEAKWLKQDFVTITPSGPLFAQVDKYEDVQDALLELFEKLGLVQSR